jgi:hypothetical protein
MTRQFNLTRVKVLKKQGGRGIAARTQTTSAFTANKTASNANVVYGKKSLLS